MNSTILQIEYEFLKDSESLSKSIFDLYYKDSCFKKQKENKFFTMPYTESYYQAIEILDNIVSLIFKQSFIKNLIIESTIYTDVSFKECINMLDTVEYKIGGKDIKTRLCLNMKVFNSEDLITFSDIYYDHGHNMEYAGELYQKFRKDLEEGIKHRSFTDFYEKKQTEEPIDNIIKRLRLADEVEVSIKNTKKYKKSYNKVNQDNKIERNVLNQEKIDIDEEIKHYSIVDIVDKQESFNYASRVNKWKKSEDWLLNYFKNYSGKYKDNTPKEVKKHKIYHEIFGVEQILNCKDADNYFFTIKDNERLYTKSAWAKLAYYDDKEEKIKKIESGMVEISIFKEDKEIYHLYFNPNKSLEEILIFSEEDQDAENDNEQDKFTYVGRSSMEKDKSNNYVIKFFSEHNQKNPSKTLHVLPFSFSLQCKIEKNNYSVMQVDSIHREHSWKNS